MPQIKNYEGKKKSASKVHTEEVATKAEAKRRPHREMKSAGAEPEVAEVEVAINTEAQNEGVVIEDVVQEEQASAPKTHLEFYGSELIRQNAPKVMEFADAVAEEWVHDGEFYGLPVGHPLAQFVARKAFRKAKDVEKKLEEKGVFVLANMGLDYLKAEINKRKKT